MNENELTFDDRGLIPAVVQDADSGQVLMMAWMNRESLAMTRQSGETVFWSRSRQTLWHKGATSGNTQRVRAIFYDCDGDTLLITVDPAGPACHGSGQLLLSPIIMMPTFKIEQLFDLIEDRKANPRDGSYTNQLLSDTDQAVQKVGEEATEVIIAALNQGPERLISESADLLYHLLVVLSAQGVTWREVVEELQRRHQSRA